MNSDDDNNNDDDDDNDDAIVLQPFMQSALFPAFLALGEGVQQLTSINEHESGLGGGTRGGGGV